MLAISSLSGKNTLVVPSLAVKWPKKVLLQVVLAVVVLVGHHHHGQALGCRRAPGF